MADKPPPKPGKRPLMGLKPQDWRALGIGLELAAVIGGAAWLGNWADGKLGTSPWIALAGVVFGITGGGWHALKMANGGKLPEIPGITAPGKQRPGTKKPGRETPQDTQAPPATEDRPDDPER